MLSIRNLRISIYPSLLKSFVVITGATGLGIFSAVSSASALTFVPIPNGDFETGQLSPDWTRGGIDGGTAHIVKEGTNFSAFNTVGIKLSGDFAVNIRSNGPATLGSIGILTSDPFIIGERLRFSALSEEAWGEPYPVTLKVRILDSNQQPLLAKTVQTNLIRIGRIGQAPRNGIFSTHVFNTSAFAGQNVRLEFRQTSNVRGLGYFTLIDNVETTIIPAEPASVPESAPTISLLCFGMLGASRLLKRGKKHG